MIQTSSSEKSTLAWRMGFDWLQGPPVAYDETYVRSHPRNALGPQGRTESPFLCEAPCRLT